MSPDRAMTVKTLRISSVTADRKVAQRHERVVDAPSSNDAIEGGNDKAGDDIEPADKLPVRRVLAQLRIGKDGAPLGMASDHKLCEKDGKGDEKGKKDVEKNKEAASMLADEKGKFPQASQPDGRSGGSQDKADPRSPMFSLLFHKIKNFSMRK